MIKKIQQYLLVRYPLLWNTRIVPMLLVNLLLNVFFFGLGYLTTYLDFAETYHRFYERPLVYFAIVLCIIGGFILWLLQYRKNNAFGVFYPKKSREVYAEWVFIFVILFGLFLTPFSFNMGITQKIKSYAPKEEVLGKMQTLTRVRSIIPCGSKQSYFKEYPDGYTKDENGNIVKITNEEHYSDSPYYNSDEIDSIVQQTNNTLNLKDYPNFAQLSLLNQDVYNYYGYQTDSAEAYRVRNWLIEENRAEIENLIRSFLALAKEHKLQTNITAEEWMKLIYNPPTYPVGDYNLMQCSMAYETYGDHYRKESGFYVPYEELRSAYSEIEEVHTSQKTTNIFLLIIACIATMFSLLIFSNRCSSGRSWLTALISLAIVAFISFMFVAIWNVFGFGYRADMAGVDLYILFWIGIFAGELIYVIRLMRGNRNKGRTTILIHHLLWFLPLIPMMFLLIVTNHTQHHYNVSDCNSICTTCAIQQFIENNIIGIIWANIGLLFISMWFFVSCVLRKWKSLPEK